MAGKATKTTKPDIKLNSYESLFGDRPDYGDATELPIKELHDYKQHPFRVIDDEDMLELVQSIKDKGILVPLTVRPVPEGDYEIISGHRRKHAAEIAGLTTVPAIIRDLSDEDAVDIMIYSNIQRTNILPSEKANAYRLQMEIMKHQGKKGSSTPNEVGKKYGDNARKVQRLVRLTYLLPELLELVDRKKLAVQAGYWISFLGDTEQECVLKAYQLYGKLPSGSAAQHLREQYEDHVLTKDKIEELILGESPRRRVILKMSRINRIFSQDYDSEQIEEIIYRLLEHWSEEKGQEQSE